MSDREALTAASDLKTLVENGEVKWVLLFGDSVSPEIRDWLSRMIAAARERLAQLEDPEGNRLHGLIREWNPDLNDYAVMKFAKEIMDALNGETR